MGKAADYGAAVHPVKPSTLSPARMAGIVAASERISMPRHATYVPHGVIPAVLLPFFDDLSIDEASYRRHLADVASVPGLSAVTNNAHAS